MEAQKPEVKPRRFGNLSFPPCFKLILKMEHPSAHESLDQEMVLDSIVGIDRRNSWYSPNDGCREPDPIEPQLVKSDYLSSEWRCNNERNMIQARHLDAYLRYVQNIAMLLQERLSRFGVNEVEVHLSTEAFVATFPR